MYNLHSILPKRHFSFYHNCVGKMGNGKGLGNLFLCTEKLFWFSTWKYILVFKYPVFLPVDSQLHCTIFSRLKTPSNLNYPVLGFFFLHIDFIRPLPPSKGNIYCFICIDRYSNWMDVIFLNNISANTVAKAFYSNLILRLSKKLDQE